VLSPLLILAVAQAPAVTFDPEKPRLGDPMIVYVENTDISVDRGAMQLFGYEISLHRVSAGFLRGVAPIPMDVTPQKYPVQILVGAEQHEVQLEVVDRTWETSELSVSRRFTQKKPRSLQLRLRREAKEFTDLWARDVTPPKFVGKVEPPLPGIRTSPFGVQRTFNGKKKSTHFGMDLDGKPGDPIKAIADGRVVLSSMRWASGGTIVLDHGGGLFTLYFHMSKRSKKLGELVKRGDVIGNVGQTGRVTGPHLHLATVVRSVRLSGPRKGEARAMYVDPERLLGLDLKGHPAFVMPVPPVAQQ
jgi:hypothetical protein